MKLIKLRKEDEKEFKKLMIDAFQFGFESYTKKKEEQVLPECDIDNSLNDPKGIGYEMIDEDGTILGGAIVTINDTNINNLDFLFVRIDMESHGIGKLLWDEIEKLHPETIKWQTCTPYFDQRNIHFYVNKLKFHIVEYYNKYHIDPHMDYSEQNDECFEEDGGMFEFEKVMK